jgi:hemoglobin/transferrin/lactoferrin receptor protein
MIKTKTAAMCVLALALGVPVHGQSGELIMRGVVRDPQGEVIAGATVDIGCGSTRRHLTTSATGEFSTVGLPPGRCSVTGMSEFFEPESIVVDSNSVAPLILILQIRKFASEVVVTPTRGVQESTFDLPEAVSVTSARDIDSRPYTLLLQVLREEPGILLQQTTTAQTSPVIRGFTGQSNVYLLDGVRLNTGSWRTGPSQYSAWVDAAAINSIEVMRGNGSVQYGSDALGGTVQLLSAPLSLGLSDSKVHGVAEMSGASADMSHGGRAGLALHARSVAVRIGGSLRRVDDLRTGRGRDSHSSLTRFLGLPSTLLGRRRQATSFDQGGAYAQADVSPRAGAQIHGFFMHEDQRGVSRYDRLLGGDGLFRSGFDPQRLDFGLVRYTASDFAKLNGGISLTFSINRQNDGRFEQRRPQTTLDRQTATTTALGYHVEAHHDFASRHRLVVGSELFDEDIAASREVVDTNGRATPLRPDIPDATAYKSFGVFAQHRAEVIPDRLSLRGGVRYSAFGFTAQPDPPLGVTQERVKMRSMTFQAATVFGISRRINLTANVSRGFRAPNAADLGSIGLTGGGGFEITPGRAIGLNARVGSTAAADAISTGEPVAALQPEVVYQYEVGLKARLGPFNGWVNGFDMELSDFIQRRALVFESNIVGTTISGFEIVRQDGSGLAYIAGDVRPIATRINLDRARILGAEAEGEVRLTPSLTGSAYFSVSNGRALPSGEFVRRMPPPMGGAKLRWTDERFWAESVVTFAAEQKRLNSADLSDARIGGLRTRASIATFFNEGATDLGLVRGGIVLATGETLVQVQDRVLGNATSAPLFLTQPGFMTLGLRGGLRFTGNLDVAVFLENLTDVNYRMYGSGVDAPGFNVQVRTRYRF